MVFRRAVVSYQKDEGFMLNVEDYDWRIMFDPVAGWPWHRIWLYSIPEKIINWVEKGISKEVRIPITREQADELAWSEDDWGVAR